MRRIEIGAVRSTTPARREIRVTPFGGRDRYFSCLGLVEIALRDGTVLRCRVQSARDETDGKILLLSPGVPRETVARMKAAVISIETAETEAAGYELEELQGLSVVDESGEDVGEVTELYSSGSNDVMEITRPDGRTVLVPVIEQVVASVDLKRGVVVVKDLSPYAVEDEEINAD